LQSIVANLQNQVQGSSIQSTLDAHKSEFRSNIAEMATHVAGIKDKVQAHEQAIKSAYISISEAFKQATSAATTSDTLVIAHASLATLVNDVKNIFTAKIDAAHASLKAVVDTTVQKAIPCIDVNAIASDVKNKIKTDIDVISTDASNASLKYNNVSAEIVLINKKIENLYLLIKKLDLAQSS
jgi:hypothetical protein